MSKKLKKLNQNNEKKPIAYLFLDSFNYIFDSWVTFL